MHQPLTISIAVAVFAGFYISYIDSVAAEEPVEEIENVEVVDVQDASASDVKPLSFLQIVGRNHAAAVHLPIGFLFALCFVEILRLASKKSTLETCGYALSIGAALSFVPAAITGMLRATEIFEGRDAPELFFEHRNLMIAAAAVFLVSLGLRFAKKNELKGKFQIAYLSLLGIALVLAAVGAHHGGVLVYGENFLPY
jgi:uncharacterized membrane protein